MYFAKYFCHYRSFRNIDYCLMPLLFFYYAKNIQSDNINNAIEEKKQGEGEEGQEGGAGGGED